MINNAAADRVVAEPEESEGASCEKVSSSTLGGTTRLESSQQRPLPDKPLDRKIPHGGIAHISEMGEFDVLAGRGRVAWNNKGNQHFRVVMSQNVQRYMDAETCHEKTKVIISVTRYMRQELGTEFYKETTAGTYRLLDKRETHEKVGHALRDMAKAKAKSGGAGGDGRRSSESSTPSNPSSLVAYYPTASNGVTITIPPRIPTDIIVPSMSHAANIVAAQFASTCLSEDNSTENPFDDLLDHISSEEFMIEADDNEDDADIDQTYEPIPLSKIRNGKNGGDAESWEKLFLPTP